VFGQHARKRKGGDPVNIGILVKDVGNSGRNDENMVTLFTQTIIKRVDHLHHTVDLGSESVRKDGYIHLACLSNELFESFNAVKNFRNDLRIGMFPEIILPIADLFPHIFANPVLHGKPPSNVIVGYRHS
jgi:hypothetical protein